MIKNSDSDQIERLNSRVVELLRERDALVKALVKIEYTLRKDSLVDNERVVSARIAALAALASIKERP